MSTASSAPSTSPGHGMPRPWRWRWLAWSVAVVLCLAVFGMYTVPDFMVMLADQMWACF
ncbi:hypothetical protein KW843_12385 [Acidovorax sp. sif1233]|uniref:hypothetical protein n=1 Tax=Acidovorax sp. sif1233 TaxID=2854792 RepID=UPI001C48B2FE|nr:hypothetical protein [Acidovorax sp. sif1233]MBV7455271.1 hypothetical protein [Acidovorax sp. sif1233]